MPPRHQTALPPQAASTQQNPAFYCALCGKGYARNDAYDAHLGSYDHLHRQRARDVRAMVRDPNAGARARRIEEQREAAAGGGVSLVATARGKDGSGDGGEGAGAGEQPVKKGGFKKSGFKSGGFVSLGGGGGGGGATQDAVGAGDKGGSEDNRKRDDNRAAAGGNAAPAVDTVPLAGRGLHQLPGTALTEDDEGYVESDSEEENDVGFERYDPRHPTD